MCMNLALYNSNYTYRAGQFTNIISGRAGRRDDVRAFSLLLSSKKARQIDRAAEMYRNNTTECRRTFLAKAFPVMGTYVSS